jgi:hypothetical protein
MEFADAQLPVKSRLLNFSRELKKCDFGVAIFGSARIQKNSSLYEEVFELARMIGRHGYDLITGGGPGIMEAASAGHDQGDKLRRADMIGLTIKLPFEESVNKYLELRKDFSSFSQRLEHFMALSNVLVVCEGGVGTLLELSFSWQLLQVGHIEYKPVILVGEMWKELINWMKKYMLREKLVSEKDFRFIYLVDTPHEAMKIIDKYHRKYVKDRECTHIPGSLDTTKKPR